MPFEREQSAIGGMRIMETIVLTQDKALPLLVSQNVRGTKDSKLICGHH